MVALKHRYYEVNNYNVNNMHIDKIDKSFSTYM